MSKQMRMTRFFTNETDGPYAGVTWTRRDAFVPNADGTDKFRLKAVEAPDFWTERALRTAAQKYFVGPDVTPVLPEGETSVRQMIDGVSNTIAQAAVDQGRMDEFNAMIFRDELKYLLIHQYGAFNSPVWFNCRRFHTYGIEGGQGMWAWYPPETEGEPSRYERASSAYARPQCSACFLVPVKDSLLEPGGITDWWHAAATIFKYGSGIGTNVGALRERNAKLRNGGVSSGLMSFLKPFDAIGGTLQSAGTTRRAATMFCLDVSHPEIEGFVELKMKEEKKALDLLSLGYSNGMEGEAYSTVTGQNANFSVRVTDDFMNAVERDEAWQLVSPLDGLVKQTVRAKELWHKIVYSAWSCADPGLHYVDVQQEYHTAPSYGPITTSNPCSEYLHADNTACNLASLRLTKFLREDGTFDAVAYRRAGTVFLMAQEILVDLSSYPTREIAKNSHELRPLGLGFLDLGSFLMVQGIPYDSDLGRAYAAALTALLGGNAYATSARMAATFGPFEGFMANRETMLGVVKKHAASCDDLAKSVARFALRDDVIVKNIRLLVEDAKSAWKEAVDNGINFGYRNSQTTLFAPTGTIAYLMDAETTGIEPELALIKYKALAGGGQVALPNRMIGRALQRLGYDEKTVKAVLHHVETSERGVEGAPGLNDNDVSVFDCAYPGPKGTRYLSPEAHLNMMAACQPFLSGAISKTVNLPESATVEEMDRLYRLAWKLKLKAVAIYRNNSKGAQPVRTHRDAPVVQSRTLPDERNGKTWEVLVDGFKVFIRSGEYEDGSLGEIFLDISREGSTLGGFAAMWAQAVSIGVQGGVPLDKFLKAFLDTRFEPHGVVRRHKSIKHTSSLVDLVMRVVAVHYLKRADLANVREFVDGDDAVGPVETPTRAAFDGSGPPCPDCGTITERNARCHRCPNCGTSLGCS